MLGLGGFGSGGHSYGMGIELGFKYPGKTGMLSATRDYQRLEKHALRADKATTGLGISKRDLFRKDMMLVGGLTSASVAMSAFYGHTEQAMADVHSLGLTRFEVQKLEKDLHDLMVIERLPVGFRSAESAIYDLISASVKIGDAKDVLRETGFLAKGTMGTMQDATEFMAVAYEKMWNKMEGTAQEKARKIADAAAASTQKYKLKLPGLAKEFSDVAGSLPSNWGIQESVPLVGVLMGRYAGTTGARVRSFVTKIATAQKKLNLDLADNFGMAKKPLEIIDELIKKYGTVIDLAEEEELKSVYGEYTDTVKTLIEFRDRYVEGYREANRFGLAQEMAAIRSNTLKGELEVLQNKLIAIGNTYSQQGMPLQQYAEGLGKILDKIDEFGQKDPTLIKKANKLALALAFPPAGALMARQKLQERQEELKEFLQYRTQLWANPDKYLSRELTGPRKPLLEKVYELSDEYNPFHSRIAKKTDEGHISGPFLGIREFADSSMQYLQNFVSGERNGDGKELFKAETTPEVPSSGSQTVFQDNRTIKPTLVLQNVTDPESLKRTLDEYFKNLKEDQEWQTVRAGGDPADLR